MVELRKRKILMPSNNAEHDKLSPWTFLHITDPHLASDRNGVWNNKFLCSMMPEVMACLKEDVRPLGADFALVTGDIASQHSKKAIYAARDMLESLALPYYPTGGNHDFLSMRARAWYLGAYSQRLPTANFMYTFVHKNLRFCVLDPWWVWPDGSLMPTPDPDTAKRQETDIRDTRWALPPEQFVWLESVLAAFPQLPTCLVSHYPAAAVPQRLQRPGYNHAGALENGLLLLKVASKYPQVKAFFSGHVHTNSVHAIHGITQITTSALPEYPCEFREVTVFPDRMEIKTRPLSDPSFAARSLIPGHEYTAGDPEDREVVVPLC